MEQIKRAKKTPKKNSGVVVFFFFWVENFRTILTKIKYFILFGKNTFFNKKNRQERGNLKKKNNKLSLLF